MGVDIGTNRTSQSEKRKQRKDNVRARQAPQPPSSSAKKRRSTGKSDSAIERQVNDLLRTFEKTTTEAHSALLQNKKFLDMMREKAEVLNRDEAAALGQYRDGIIALSDLSGKKWKGKVSHGERPCAARALAAPRR